MTDTQLASSFSPERLDYFHHASDAWNSRDRKKEISTAYSDWLIAAKDWREFLTLTFKDEVPLDTAKNKFKLLIRHLNSEVFGHRYTRIVKHSYFSYVLATEPQKRGVVHFHVLMDRPIHYQTVHKIWNSCAGFAFTTGIKDKVSSVKYLCKYISKGGELDLYFANKLFKPLCVPKWWDE